MATHIFTYAHNLKTTEQIRTSAMENQQHEAEETQHPK